jgi:uncharacterized protein (DUF305 family)
VAGVPVVAARGVMVAAMSARLTRRPMVRVWVAARVGRTGGASQVFLALVVARMVIVSHTGGEYYISVQRARRSREDQMIRRLVLLVLGGVLIAACQAPLAPPSPTPDGAASIDRAFIDMMVPHHESAVEMAEIALERTERDEIRRMAESIIAEQQTEIEQMRAWRADWFGSRDTPPMDRMPLMPGVEMPGMPGHSGGTMDMTADLDELRGAEPFDRAFIELMIEHHQSAIAAAEVALRESDVDELRNVATSIIASQQAEIDQLSGWLAEWYGATPDATPYQTP